jgi:hypothetical protein
MHAGFAAPCEERQESKAEARLPESAGLGNKGGRAKPAQPRVFKPHRTHSVLEHGRAPSDQFGVAQLDS